MAALVTEICELFWSHNQENLDLGRHEGDGEGFLSVVITIFSFTSMLSEIH